MRNRALGGWKLTRAVAVLMAVAAMGVSGDCAVAEARSGCRGVRVRESSEFAVVGPYAVGVKTFTFVDGSRPTDANGDFPGAPARTLVTEVWYPAATAGRDAPVDPGGAPYPVVIHSHGFLDSRIGESLYAKHLASRGYVVAAPDYPLSNGGAPGGATVVDVHNQPGDWSFVLDAVLAELAGAADPAAIGASGLSLGGLTTLLVTYHKDLRDPRIKAALPMAAPSCFFTKRFYATTDTPLMVLQGDSDLLIPYRKNGRAAYHRAGPPRFLVRLRDGSHTGFSDFALLFDQSKHFDIIGCAALALGLGGTLDDGSNPFAPLGGETEGLDFDARCPLPCEGQPPAGPSMQASRHHELMQVIGSAFFDAYLRGDDSARCFLRRTLRRENPDVRARSRSTPISAP